MLKNFLSVILVASLLFIVSCSDDDNPTNGDPETFSAEGEVVSDQGKADVNYGAAAYDEDNGTTTVVLAENSGYFGSASQSANYLTFEFEGNSTGDYSIDDELDFFIDGKMFVSTSASVTITSYGDVGDFIEGSLNASLTGLADGGTATITYAEFKVRRFKDDDSWRDDDDDDDNDDDDNDDDDYKLIKNFVFDVDGLQSIQLSNTSSAGFAYNMDNISVAFVAYSDDNSLISLSINYEDFGSSAKNVQIDGSDERSAILMIENKAYSFTGTLKVKNWGAISEHIRVELEGTFTDESDSNNIKTINKFEFDVMRVS